MVLANIRVRTQCIPYYISWENTQRAVAATENAVEGKCRLKSQPNRNRQKTVFVSEMFSFTSTLLQTEAKTGGGKPEKGENNDYDRQFMERGNATHFLSTHTPSKTANAFLLLFLLSITF